MSSVQIQNLMKFMKDSSYTCTDEWLSACVNWVRENYNPVTDLILKQQALEQWKDTNLEEMESSCLPKNLANQRCIKLSGRYGLQMNSVEDIGESAYTQWNRIKKLENENTNVSAADSTEVKNTWEPKPRRCLYLTLTDGSQKVYGLELNPNPALNLELQPGTKVLILGPVECRRGVIQLRPTNLRVVGGEVEELVQRNSVEALLRETLHNPPERDPIPNVNNTNAFNVPRNNNVALVNENVIGEFPENDDFPAFGDDDDIFMEIDENELLETTVSVNNQTITNAETQLITESQFQNVQQSSSLQFQSNMDTRSSTRSQISLPQQIPKDLKKSKASLTNNNKFNPPTKTSSTSSFVPKPQSSSTISTTVPSKSNIVQTKISDFSSESTLGGFKSAKTLLPPKSKPKQLKIDGYMKPMPVTIKPPTPKSFAKKVTVSVEKDINVPGDDDALVGPFIITSDDDDSIMEVIEDSFAAELERAENEVQQVPSTAANEVLFNHKTFSSTPNVKISPPTGVVKPTSSTKKINIPIQVSKNPYVYLKQVQDHWDDFVESRNVVQIKACITTVVSNIQIVQGEWTLTVSINDGTASMNCKISSELLNDIIGFSPIEMKKMKSTKTPEAKENIGRGMKNLTTTLVHLNAIFEVEIGPDPVLMQIKDLSSFNVSALQERISYLPN